MCGRIRTQGFHVDMERFPEQILGVGLPGLSVVFVLVRNFKTVFKVLVLLCFVFPLATQGGAACLSLPDT